MSFSFHYTAASKTHALALLELQTMPAEIKAVVRRGILSAPADSSIGAYDVAGSGHLCDAPGSYEVSEVQLKIVPVRVSLPALGGAPPTHETPASRYMLARTGNKAGRPTTDPIS